MNGAAPDHAREPIGADRPLDRQNVTVSAGAASSRGRHAQGDGRVEEPGAVHVQRHAALVRDPATSRT